MWSGLGSAFVGAAGSVAGGLLSGMPQGAGKGFAREMWQKNYDAQREFAQNGIRWKVADAKAAGLHPLAALGTGSYFSPSGSIGSVDAGGGSDASWLADVGQNIGRAIDAKATAEERAKAEEANDRITNLKIEGLELDNQQKKLDQATQLAQQVTASQRAVRNTALPPAMPSLRTRPDGATVGFIMPGQGDSTSSSLFEVKPAEITANNPTRIGQEAGSHPDIKFIRLDDGGYSPVRSQAQEEALEDDALGTLAWNIRNRIKPTLGFDYSPPPQSYLPDGFDTWEYNIWNQAYYPSRSSSGILGRARKRFGPSTR